MFGSKTPKWWRRDVDILFRKYWKVVFMRTKNPPLKIFCSSIWYKLCVTSVACALRAHMGYSRLLLSLGSSDERRLGKQSHIFSNFIPATHILL
jgi:hypothetical protein